MGDYCMLSRLVLNSVCVVALTAAANAADVYPLADGYKDSPYFPVATWTGFYVGLNGGFGWSDRDSNLAATLPTIINNNLASFVETKKFNTNGGFGGEQVGYNWQTASGVVLGIEADFQGASI